MQWFNELVNKSKYLSNKQEKELSVSVRKTAFMNSKQLHLDGLPDEAKNEPKAINMGVYLAKAVSPLHSDLNEDSPGNSLANSCLIV